MKGMTPIVKTVTSLVSAFILLYGIYVVLYGHLTPGGGFAGGVILACCFILLELAFGKGFVAGIVSDRVPYVLDCVGAAAFLLIAVAGYTVGNFFHNFWVSQAARQAGTAGTYRLFSGGIIMPCNVAIGLKVAACLFGVFAVLSVFRPRGESARED